jgi:hypothetical protein
VRVAATSILAILAVGCFEPGAATRGLPCTEDGPCGSLSCEYGVCGGPVRCETGAGVGGYCYAVESREFEVEPGIDALAVGNVDFDALPDIVVGNGDAQTVALLRNLGGGELAAAVRSAPLGVSLAELTIGPVDGAAWADIVATAGGSTVLAIPIAPGAEGTGEIGGASVIASGLAGAARPQIGQFVDDGDALPDVAVLVATGFDVFPQVAPSTYNPGVHTEVAGSADLHKIGFDANPVFVASRTGNSVVAHARVSGGAFTPTTTIEVGPSPSLFVVDDLDNDTFGDLLVVSESGEMWLTTGRDSTFAMPRDPIAVYDLGWAATTLLAHNLDDDPEPEMVVSGVAASGRRDVFLFDNDGQGRPVYGGSLGIDDAASVVVADLDLDGAAEIVIVSQDSGKVRVARRAVAPPLPGGEETSVGSSTGDDPTVDPSSPSDPSLTTSPMTSDPSTDPTFPSDDTGVEPSCPPDAVNLGSTCYGPVGVVGVSSPVLEVVVEPLDGLGASLVALTTDGSVWAFSGNLFGSFDPMKGYIVLTTPASPTGLAVGTLELQIDPEVPAESAAIVAATHAGGISMYAPSLGLFGDWDLAAAATPVIGRLIDRDGAFPLGGLAFSTDDQLLQVLDPASIVSGSDPLWVDTSALVTDIDIALVDAFDVGLVVASGGAPEIFAVPEQFPPFSLGPLTPDPTSVYTKLFVAQAPMFASAGIDTLEVYESVDDELLLVYDEPISVVSDFAAANVDGAPGDELLALIDYGDGTRYLRVWTVADFGFTPLADLAVINLSAFATTNAFGADVSDILLAFTDLRGASGILHLGLLQ